MPDSFGFRSAYRTLFFIFVVFALPSVGHTQKTGPAPIVPKYLPYAFSNFVWWNDDELRKLLKSRISGLGDEIVIAGRTEEQLRDTLRLLMREKGISAEVLSVEPSDFELTAERAEYAPAPAIVFSILSPKILVGKVIISNVPTDQRDALNACLQNRVNHDYSDRQNWWAQSEAERKLKENGYLESKVVVSRSAPRHETGRYLVDLLISVNAGPQYRIAAITADGGPLLTGKDLSPFFSQKVGDIAGGGPFGDLAAKLRYFYAHYGYADVEISGPPMLDREHALVTYQLNVKPGRLYHLRSLTIHNLSEGQESKVRQLLSMRAGGIFDEAAINLLYQQIAKDPFLASMSFTFSPKKDTDAAAIDLTLDFYRQSDKSSVTIQ